MNRATVDEAGAAARPRGWATLWSDPFARSLAAVTALGLLVRLVYVLGFRRDLVVGGDPYFYHYGANLLVHGKGFIAPLQYRVLHTRLEAADHPPLYMLYLAIPSALGLGTTLVHLVWSAALGTATVTVTGLLGRRVAGPRAGLIAAAIVALTPNVWIYDGAVLSETMAIFTATLVLLFAYRAWERPTTARVCALGAACGLAMLARSELVLLVPTILWPVALLAGRRHPKSTELSASKSAPGALFDADSWKGFRRAAVGSVVALAVVAPWVGYNMVRFRHPVYLSSQAETTLAGSNCPDTYYGHDIGLFTQTCLELYPLPPGQDESVSAQTLRKGAEHYIRTHLGRAPLVAAARVGRVTGLYRVSQQVDLDVFVEGRERPLVVVGLLAGYLTEIAAVAGAVVVRRRRGAPVFPLVAVPAVVLFTVAVTYATDRFRASAETALAVLAAVALDALWQRWRTSQAPRSG